jgi:hypothetical protein
MSLYIITIERQEGVTEYWSQYGGWNIDRPIAREFSLTAADARLKTIHNTSRHPQYQDWAGAKMEKVVHKLIIT